MEGGGPGSHQRHRKVCEGTKIIYFKFGGSVADPHSDPDPPDPHVFGPPGSGSISQRYGSGSGSGSFYHQANCLAGLSMLATPLRMSPMLSF